MKRSIFLLMFLTLASHPAHSQSTPQKTHAAAPEPPLETDGNAPIYGTFSSLRYIGEAGDVLGYEVIVLPQYESAYVVFQCAEGEPSEPVMVPAETTPTTVKFKIDVANGSCNGAYKGTLTPKGLKLTSIDAPNQLGTLPRRKSYWAH